MYHICRSFLTASIISTGYCIAVTIRRNVIMIMGIRSEERQLHEHFTIKPAACCSRYGGMCPMITSRWMDARHSLQWKIYHPRVSLAPLHSLLPHNDDKCDSLLAYTYEQVRRMLYYTVSLHVSQRKFHAHSVLSASYKMFKNFISRLDENRIEFPSETSGWNEIVKFPQSNKLNKLSFKHIF